MKVIVSVMVTCAWGIVSAISFMGGRGQEVIKAMQVMVRGGGGGGGGNRECKLCVCVCVCGGGQQGMQAMVKYNKFDVTAD